jgi:cytochrome c
MYMFESSPKIHLLTISILAITFIATPMSHADDSGLNFDHRPNLGQEVTSYVSSIVSPDGSGLPSGVGSVPDGRTVYMTKCAACHGMDGKLTTNPLVGGEGTLKLDRPIRTVGSYWPYATTLYDYIARAMPYNQEKSLSVNEIYSVTAFVLNLNGILGDDDELDQTSLPEIRMPNRSGFIELID